MSILFSAYKKISKSLSGYGLGNNKIIKKIKRFIFMKTKPEFIIVNGNKMYLDKLDSMRILTQEFEPIETRLVKEKIKKGETVLDIGANIGYYTLIFSKLVGPKGKVFSFEPDIENFKILKKNVKVNNCKNVILVNKAVSDKNGTEKMTIFDGNRGRNTVGARDFNDEEITSKEPVKTIAIDEYLDKNIKVDFIKIDIQGSEYKAFKGLRKVIKRSNNLKILAELSPSCLEMCGAKVDEYIKELKKNFNIYTIDKGLMRTNGKNIKYRSENYTDLYGERKKK